jgi:hypothetical protein
MSGWNEWNEFVRKNNISKEKQIQLYKDVENDLKRIEKQLKKELVQNHEIDKYNNNNKKTYANKYYDRSDKVKLANELYDSYEYMKEEREPKPERKSVCNKYIGALTENCTIMFGGKRRTKKSKGNKSKSKRKTNKSKGKKSMRKRRSSRKKSVRRTKK